MTAVKGAPVNAGDILARKYRVERVLGTGNMGVVVAATHVELGKLVALKFMLAHRAGDKELRERFLREARASVRLKSQHVARVLDVGTLDDDAPYIVMEFLEGLDLSTQLKDQGPLPVEVAVEYVLQACEAIAEAHANNIVHRDLKPANLFLTHDDITGMPCVKVVDFGISKQSGVELSLTNEEQALGTPLYMSPEQMNSAKNVDTRTDIWALGIILYTLCAGKTPFHSETIQELCMRVLTGNGTPLDEYRKDVPAGFEAVILRCLKQDREQRYRDVAEFANALAPFAPVRARVYVERVARVLATKPRAPSSPELPPSIAPAATKPAATNLERQSTPQAPTIGEPAASLGSATEKMHPPAEPSSASIAVTLVRGALTSQPPTSTASAVEPQTAADTAAREPAVVAVSTGHDLLPLVASTDRPEVRRGSSRTLAIVLAAAVVMILIGGAIVRLVYPPTPTNLPIAPSASGAAPAVALEHAPSASESVPSAPIVDIALPQPSASSVVPSSQAAVEVSTKKPPKTSPAVSSASSGTKSTKLLNTWH